MKCPYCQTRLSDSADHIFPQFLGGKARISACRTCNSSFGSDFEGKASVGFYDLMFLFRRCGLKPPRPKVWKRKNIDDSGRLYDIDQDLKATPSVPIVERRGDGKIARVTGARKAVEAARRSLIQQGRNVKTVELPPQRVDMRSFHLRYPFDDNVKRLCVKMSLALAVKTGFSLTLDTEARAYLLDGRIADVCPVRITADPYREIDTLRPPLGHLIYLRGSRQQQLSYSVVQFFGGIRFFCHLARNYNGADFAAIGIHDPVKHEEKFTPTACFDFPEPQRFLSSEEWKLGRQNMYESMRLQLVHLFGDEAPITFGDTGELLRGEIEPK